MQTAKDKLLKPFICEHKSMNIKHEAFTCSIFFFIAGTSCYFGAGPECKEPFLSIVIIVHICVCEYVNRRLFMVEHK